MENLKDWTLSGKSLFRVFCFDDWNDITNFLIFLTNLIKELDHHPDILFHTSSKSITIFLTTHSEGGVSEKDILFAQKLDEFYDKINR